jgi:hypothetical protein
LSICLQDHLYNCAFATETHYAASLESRRGAFLCKLHHLGAMCASGWWDFDC